MELEYREISEERCKEIDSWEIHDSYGYGSVFTAEREDFVTNADESILFGHAFMPRHDDRESNDETYLFVQGKEHHIVNYVVDDVKTISENSWIVYVNIIEKDFINNGNNELIGILKRMISIFIKKSRLEIPGECIEYHFYYKGEEV